MPLSLDSYRLLGRSGLRVSPLALGAMTFGEVWGTEEADARRMFDTYVDRGGNFVDTAGYYARGRSEALVGKFAREKRERLVLSTKYSMATTTGDPNAAGNGRKNMVGTVETSLKRMQIDAIDLLFLHMWDDTTPADEILRGLDDLVRQGKVLYIGVSDTPAWNVAWMQAVAELRGWTRFIALQAEYNLLHRTPERELLPMAKACGLGVMPWSPLANGLLSGKYDRNSAANPPKEGRGGMLVARGLVNERQLSVVDAVKEVADGLNATPAQVALAWTLVRPEVDATLIGARTLAQLTDNLGALALSFSPEDLAKLDVATAIELGFPHDFLKLDFIRAGLTGGTTVRPRR